MALGSSVSEEAGGGGREIGAGEKRRWEEVKVYRRRSFKGGESNGVPSEPTTTITVATIINDDGNSSQISKNKINENNNLVEVSVCEVNHSDEGNHSSNRIGGNDVVESEKPVSGLSSIEIPAENGNLKQIQPEIAVEVISDKALNSDQTDEMISVSVDPPVMNGAPRASFSVVDGKFKFNVSSTSKPQLLDLKRKFENEIYMVRKVARKMEGRGDETAEFVHPAASNGLLVNGVRGNGFANSVHPGTMYLGLVPHKPNIRPFNQMRVSVVGNGQSMFDSIEREKRTPKANQFYRNSDFLLANDRFPPAESNKKSKSSGKKSSGECGFGVGSMVYKSCSALLEKLMKHKHGWVFNTPVDAKGLGLHDYFLIIKNPMDLSTVKAKLSRFWYKSPMEFAEDVRLTFNNAMLYNPKGQDVHIMAETLLKIFENKWPDIELKYLRELRMAVDYDVGLPTPQSWRSSPFQLSAFRPSETRVFSRSESMPQPLPRNPNPRTLTPAPSFRTPAFKKPKAKDVNKRDMTHHEKQKLSTNLQSLPPEKLDGVIQIIKRKSTALSQNDDEIEVDLDSVDTETLWELDRFVSNFKKSLSKNRRKAELANQMRADARQTMQQTTNPLPSVALAENTTGNGTLLSPARGNGLAAIASGSNSSSSSSSSGSSSSDSDSDSSSSESDIGGQSPGI